MAARTRRRTPEPSTAETDALRVELRQIGAAWRGGVDARNAAFCEEVAAKRATEPKRPPIHVSVLNSAS
jgi:hypothetical protein